MNYAVSFLYLTHKKLKNQEGNLLDTEGEELHPT